MRLTLFAVCALAAGASGCGGGPPRGAPLPSDPPRVLLSADTLVFTSFDANNDLRIDHAELEAGIAREFARADVNSDGALTPLEFQSWMTAALGGANAPPYRLDFDRNVDNSITRAEFESELNARAELYDSDHDGVLVRSEFIREAPRQQMMLGPRGPGGPGGGEMRRRPGG